MTLRRRVDLSVGRPPGRDWKRRPGRLIGSIKFSGTRTSHQWNSGGMPYDVVMVLERCNGPCRLRDHDDDDDDEIMFSRVVSCACANRLNIHIISRPTWFTLMAITLLLLLLLLLLITSVL